MKTYIYDIEVYEKDFIVIFLDVETEEYIIACNETQTIDLILKDKPILVGFNNKHYDNYILKAIYKNYPIDTINYCNNLIISGKKNGWEIELLQNIPTLFYSIDLKDDLPLNVSLKSIEGAMYKSIVECSVPFNIGRKLTNEELKEVIKYCKYDVFSTYQLYKNRKDYLNAKKTIAEMMGVEFHEICNLTNAKLSSKFLKASKFQFDKNERYKILDNIQLNKYKLAKDFFEKPLIYALKQGKTTKQIAKMLERPYNELKYKMNICNIEHTLAFGGLHGAINNYIDEEDENYLILMIDVTSYYPNLMILYDFISRGISDKQIFLDTVDKRIQAKKDGNIEVADALKLVINIVYGALKNQYNELYDPTQADNVCVNGQLLLIDLIEHLEINANIKLIQSNTDGICVKVEKKKLKTLFNTVKEWEERTGLRMEYTVIEKIFQKDVNNYAISTRGVFTTPKHYKVKRKTKVKGAYTSKAYKNTLDNANLSIVHKALVEKMLYNKPIEETINNCNDIFMFQNIVKVGRTYEKCYLEVNGEYVEVNRVNRVYASKDKEHKRLYKLKYIEHYDMRMEKVANVPDNCIIDNDNKLTIDDIDKSYYIELAYERLKEFTKGE